MLSPCVKELGCETLCMCGLGALDVKEIKQNFRIR